MESFKIKQIKANAVNSLDDFVAEEIPFTLNISDRELVTLLCTPGDLDNLVKGFLFTSGLIKKVVQIKKIVIDQQKWTAYVELVDDIQMEELVFKRLYTSGCGRGTLFYNALDIMHRSKIKSELKIKNTLISRLMADFQKKSETYLKTGGVHSAAMANSEKILFFAEDIGRHNAIDKAIGTVLSENESFEDKILITSGRISSEVIFKMRKCQTPIVISKSAPTNQAVKLSRDMNITLVGFARGNRMNIYSGFERIEL